MGDGILSGLRDPGAEAVGLGGYVHKDAVRDLLRSDETREALVEAMIREVARRSKGGSTFDLCADAVIRVLAGQEAEQ